MRRIFEFQCVKGHITEKLVDDEVRIVECIHCRNDASRIISTPRIMLDGCSGDFPSAADAWVRRRESHMKYERKVGISNSEG